MRALKLFRIGFKHFYTLQIREDRIVWEVPPVEEMKIARHI